MSNYDLLFAIRLQNTAIYQKLKHETTDLVNWKHSVRLSRLRVAGSSSRMYSNFAKVFFASSWPPLKYQRIVLVW